MATRYNDEDYPFGAIELLAKSTGELSDDRKSYNKKLKKEEKLIAHGNTTKFLKKWKSYVRIFPKVLQYLLD